MRELYEGGAALVTGGSRRIGRAIAERLAALGYALAVHASPRSLPEAQEFVAKLRESGVRAEAFCCDLADVKAIAELIPAASAALGPITLLVNNASIFEDDSAENFDCVSFDRHIAINLRAPVHLVSLFAAALPDDREGNVVNVIDQRVWRLTPEFFSYTLAKSALWTATRTLAQTFAPRIRVNAVGPGPVLPNGAEGEAGFALEIAEVPLRSAVTPAEIAGAVAYLASARSVTGQMIAVDAGQHLP
ncbi:MAG TPA: SDR family oxidoreductase [Beijerinckiaceae bacterium]|nr:SDR family oxidoreductase [Beijerinckiaceae bacterium]